MEGNVKKIIFIFENCDTVEILGRHIGLFNMGGFKTSISRSAINCIEKSTVANYVAMEIFSEANTSYKPFGQLDEEKVFNRIMEKDITSIEVVYEGKNVAEDGTTETYRVPYNEGKYKGLLGAKNINQKVCISDLGNLYLVISKNDIKLKRVFSKQYMNNEVLVNKAKFMYDVLEPAWNVIQEDKPAIRLPELFKDVWLQKSDGHVTHGILKKDAGKPYWQTYKTNYSDNETKSQIDDEKKELNSFVAWKHI